MTVILTLDDRGGMSFNGRRQSRDRLLIADLLSELRARGVTRLVLAPSSASLFPEDALSAAGVTLCPKEDLSKP